MVAPALAALEARVEALELLGPAQGAAPVEGAGKVEADELVELRADKARLEYRILTLLRSFDEADAAAAARDEAAAKRETELQEHITKLEYRIMTLLRSLDEADTAAAAAKHR
jgi:hypothetical protein